MASKRERERGKAESVGGKWSWVKCLVFLTKQESKAMKVIVIYTLR